MTTIGGSIDVLAASWLHRARWRPAALLAVGAVVLLLEVASGDLDHGTHLLVALTVVLGTTMLLGPAPGIAGLAIGAGVAATVSMTGTDAIQLGPGAVVQLAAYLLLGSATIALVAVAVRGHASGSSALESASGQRDASARAIAPTPSNPIDPLTPRELDILRRAATGITVEEIARDLGVSPNTVKTHLAHVYDKLGARGRTDAVRAGMHAGWLTPGDICPHHFGDECGESPVSVTTSERPGQTI